MTSRLLRSVLGKSMRDQKRALIGYSIGLVAFIAMIVAIWPSFQDQQEDLQAFLDAYPPAFKAAFDIGEFDATGFLKGELFSFMLPILLLVFAIGRGADTIAGEEERGTMEVLLTHPVPRRRILLEKAAAIGIGLAILCAVILVALLLGTFAIGMDVAPGRIAGMVLMLFLVALFFGALALALGALRPRRGVALGIAAAVGVAGFLVQTISRIVERVEAIRWISPFHYYNGANPLVEGVDWVHALVLLVATLALVALAAWGFERRDVGT